MTISLLSHGHLWFPPGVNALLICSRLLFFFFHLGQLNKDSPWPWILRQTWDWHDVTLLVISWPSSWSRTQSQNSARQYFCRPQFDQQWCSCWTLLWEEIIETCNGCEIRFLFFASVLPFMQQVLPHLPPRKLLVTLQDPTQCRCFCRVYVNAGTQTTPIRGWSFPTLDLQSPLHQPLGSISHYWLLCPISISSCLSVCELELFINSRTRNAVFPYSTHWSPELVGPP